MLGVRFYEELRHKNRRNETSVGTVLAVFCDTLRVSGCGGGGAYDAIGALYDEPNAPVCSTSVAIDYLRTDCRRVSETRAREVHPRLFERLD